MFKNFFSENRAVNGMWKTVAEPDRTQMAIRLQTHTQNTKQLLFHSNNGYANAPQCYVIRTLPVFFFA